MTLLFYVNGFNSSMEYKTKVVECNLVFGDEYFSVPAICVPSIRNALTLPGLSALVSDFCEGLFIGWFGFVRWNFKLNIQNCWRSFREMN